MAKRKSKTIRRKKGLFPHFHSFFFSFAIIVTALLIAMSFEQDVTYTQHTAAANQLPKQETAKMLAGNFVLSQTATSSPTIDLPITENLEKSFDQPASKAAALAHTDYCLNVPVVMYHHVQPLAMADLLGHEVLTVDSTIFDEQMHYLSQNDYTAISSEELVNALYERRPLPEKSIMITIDDGYDDNYTYAFMSAKKYHMIMNFMIPTGLIDKSGYMNWDHLSEMASNPYARLYNHTTTHAPLGLIDKSKIVEEIESANADFKTRLGITNAILTYPYGSYDDEALETAKEVGIKAAFSTDEGRTHCLSTIMKLPRLRIGNAPMESYGF